MLEPRASSVAFAARAVLLSLVFVLLALPATAQSNNSNFVLLLSSGFLCDPGDSSTCPATAKASAGDSYEMSGAGTFDARSKSVKAAGTYTHRSPNGNVLESGVWIVNELVSFDSYGAAPGALPNQVLLFGLNTMGPKRMPMARGSMPTGGLGVFRIQLLSISGLSTTAVLQVNCTLGDVPRERSVEGIRLKIERNDAEYSEELGGHVVFLSMKSEMGTRVKPPQEEKAPETSEQPQH